MALKTGYSRHTIATNIMTLLKEGKTRPQAVAAALEAARLSYFKKYPQGALPMYLAYPGGRRLKKNPSKTVTAWINEFRDIASRVKNESEFYNEVMKYKDVPKEVSEWFKNSYDYVSPRQASDMFYRDIVSKKPLSNPISKIPDLTQEYTRAYIVYWAAFERGNVVTMKKAEALMKRIAAKAPEYVFWPSIPSQLQKSGNIRANPVPPSKTVQIRDASALYQNFSGHTPEVVDTIKKPIVPDVLVAVGDVDGIMYTTVRDGALERYIHKFHKDAKPEFCVSPDGDQIFFIGGEYDFTERGIVDRTDPKQQE